MSNDRWTTYGAAAGAVAIVLFAVAGALLPPAPDFDASAAEYARYLSEEHERIQISCAFFAATGPFLVWFLATIVSLLREAPPGARHAGRVAFGCGLVFLAMFLTDITTLAVSALRPENMLASPELAAALRDMELLLMGTASFTVAGMLVALSTLPLRHGLLWPRWMGWLAVAAAALYLLRAGTLFTDEGAFAADGVLGFWVPVAALAGSVLVGSVTLALRQRGSMASRGPTPSATS